MHLEELTTLANKKNITKLIIEVVRRDIKQNSLEISLNALPDVNLGYY